MAIENDLENGIIVFMYKKTADKNGVQHKRFACGTRDTSLMSRREKAKVPKAHGGDGPDKYGLVTYWDLYRHMWRCFNPKNYIKTVHKYKTYKDYLAAKKGGKLPLAEALTREEWEQYRNGDIIRIDE